MIVRLFFLERLSLGSFLLRLRLHLAVVLRLAGVLLLKTFTGIKLQKNEW